MWSILERGKAYLFKVVTPQTEGKGVLLAPSPLLSSNRSTNSRKPGRSQTLCGDDNSHITVTNSLDRDKIYTLYLLEDQNHQAQAVL